MRNPSRRYWRVALIMLLVVAALAVAAPAAFAHGSIEGTITATATGAPLENIHAYAFEPSDVTSTTVPNLALAVGEGTTDSLGHYSIDNIPGGPLANPHMYRVWFKDMFPFNHYVAQWYMGSSPYDAAAPGWALVPVVDNVATQNIDDTLTAACTLSGNVAGLEGIEVYVYASPGGDVGAWVESIQSGTATPDAVTDVNGDYMVRELNPTGGPAGPTAYYVYFYDPSGLFAPMWYGGAAPWMGPGTALTQPFGTVDMTASVEVMEIGSTIAGAVDGDVGDGHEYDLEGITVSVYGTDGKSVWFLMGTDVTDQYGRFSIGGLPVGEYFVSFVDPDGDYFSEWFENVGLDTGNPFTDGADIVTIDDPGYQDNGVYALMQPIPHISWLHPPFGVNDGPDRYNTEVSIGGWGMWFLDGWRGDVRLVKQTAPFTVIHAISYTTDDATGATAVFNLATPLAPTGTYNLVYDYYDYALGEWVFGVVDGPFQVVSSYVPTVPVTPPAPIVTPTIPAVVTPIVTPEPEPVKPADPVAGPVSVAASQASVKRGAVARLRFQVNESVLGGTTDVKIVISNKAGKVVKQVQARGVKMNSAASIAFRCKLAKGTYSYSVSAGSATATSKLIVK